MSIEKKKTRIVLTFFVLAAMLISALAITAEYSFAITTTKLPNNNTRVPDSYRLKMGYGNMTYEINPSYSSVIKYAYDNNAGGYRFSIPRSTANKTYTNPLTIHYTNCGTINGRSINIDMKINSLVQKGGNNTIANNNGYFLDLYYTSTQISSQKYNSASKYRLQHTMDITYTVTYADTGSVVNYPFFQSFYDLDTFQNTADYAEGVVPISGYTKAYLYPGTQLKQQSGGFFAPGQMEWDGNDSIVKGGVYLVTTNGSFRSRNYLTNCSTAINLYSQYNSGTLPAPTLSISASERTEPGDTVTLNVKQQIGTMYVNTFTHYNNFVISDDIPEGLTYKSAKVVDASGNNVTSKGSISYDSSTRTVTFTMNATNLNADSTYNGGTYTLQIATTADDFPGGSNKIDDIGESNISAIEQDTNQDTVTVYKPYHVSYEYVSGTEGRKLPDEISTQKGEYAISDDGTYYQGDTVNRKESPAEGTKLEIRDNEGELEGTWVLSWNASEYTIDDSDVKFTGTWRYVPAPRIIIVKKIENDPDFFTASHGEPAFLFKITGKDSGKSWYKSITFSQEAMAAVKENGSYKGPEGTQFVLQDGYIYGTCASVYLPEDDYTVEEINTIRFDTTAATARYHGDTATVIETTTEIPVTVPLRLSTYAPGSAGFSAKYASVEFDNVKSDWSRFSHTDCVINKLEGADQ